MIIRRMVIEDYDKISALWHIIKGLGIRSVDDSREGVARFLKRNPTTSIVAEADGGIVGTILCGHDGRRGYFYHVCVREDFREQGIGRRMAAAAMEALKEEQITKVSLIAFKKNETGNQFWKTVGWNFREELNFYDFSLDDTNITMFQ